MSDNSHPLAGMPAYAGLTMCADGVSVDFGVLLRERRRAAGLTQAELAARSGLAVRTVREAERGRTARPQRSTALLLADALCLTGAERAGFLGAARGGAPPIPLPRTPAASPERPSGLPPVTGELSGRDSHLDQLAELVTTSGPSPVALVGVAGVGKSSLALALAHRLAGGPARFTVQWLQVAPGWSEADLRALIDADPPVGQRLLVLDGADRAPAAVRAALGRPTGMRIITTGRVPIGLPGERLWPVPPLAAPPRTAELELSEALRYPAVAVLAEQIAAVRSEPVHPDEVSALVGLVRQLGGLPGVLAVVAEQARLLPLAEILRRLAGRELDLAGADAEPLREALTISYRALRPAEQRALRWLSVFWGRWSVEQAEQLLGSGDPVPVLDRLVSLGLAEIDGTREHRFQLLPLVRQFAREQAERCGELTAARRAHATVVTRVVERCAAVQVGPHHRAARARMEALTPDVWAALNHATNHDPPTALRLAAALPGWWRQRGQGEVGRCWLRRLLADPRTDRADPGVRAWASLGLAQLAYEQGDGEAERAAAQTALDIFAARGEVSGQLAAGRTLSAICVAAGEYDQARTYALRVLATAERHGRRREAALIQLMLAWHDLRMGELASARHRLAAADRLGAEAGDPWPRALAVAGAAELFRLAGRGEQALATGQRALVQLGQLGDAGHRWRVLGTIGQALASLGRVAEAEQVLVRLRGEAKRAPVTGVCAAIEARLALARGDRILAMEWFTAAATAYRTGSDRRELLEVLVELACLVDAERRRELLAEAQELCRRDGFTLLPRERARLAELRSGAAR